MIQLLNLGNYVELWDSFTLTRPDYPSSEEMVNTVIGNISSLQHDFYFPALFLGNQSFFAWIEAKSGVILNKEALQNAVFLIKKA